MDAGAIERRELPFSMSVFADRVRRVREGMASRGIEVLVLHSPENIYYLSGYNTPGYYYGYQSLVIPLEGDPFMVLRRVEESNVRGRSWLAKWYAYEDVDDPLDVLIRAFAKENLWHKRIGLNADTRFLTPRQYEKMQVGLPGARVVDGYGVVESLRRVKSEEEIEYIRRAALAAARAMEAGIAATVSGSTEADVAAAVYHALIKAGSEYPGMPAFVAAGYRSALAHATWEGQKRIERGDVVLLEIGGAVKRYHAVVARSVIVGEPSPRYRKIESVLLEASEAAMAAIRPGVTAAVADKAQRDVIAKHGYAEHFLHRTAYGLGVAFPPHWDEGAIISLKPGNEQVLEANMVFHLVSALYFYAEACLAITETVRVTEAGCEKITNVPRRLIVR